MGMEKLDGIPVLESVSFGSGVSKTTLKVKADKNYIYLPFSTERTSGSYLFYFKIDKRLFRIGKEEK